MDPALLKKNLSYAMAQEDSLNTRFFEALTAALAHANCVLRIIPPNMMPCLGRRIRRKRLTGFLGPGDCRFIDESNSHQPDAQVFRSCDFYILRFGFTVAGCAILSSPHDRRRVSGQMVFSYYLGIPNDLMGSAARYERTSRGDT